MNFRSISIELNILNFKSKFLQKLLGKSVKIKAETFMSSYFYFFIGKKIHYHKSNFIHKITLTNYYTIEFSLLILRYIMFFYTFLITKLTTFFQWAIFVFMIFWSCLKCCWNLREVLFEVFGCMIEDWWWWLKMSSSDSRSATAY